MNINLAGFHLGQFSTLSRLNVNGGKMQTIRFGGFNFFSSSFSSFQILRVNAIFSFMNSSSFFLMLYVKILMTSRLLTDGDLCFMTELWANCA